MFLFTIVKTNLVSVRHYQSNDDSFTLETVKDKKVHDSYYIIARYLTIFSLSVNLPLIPQIKFYIPLYIK